MKVVVLPGLDGCRELPQAFVTAGADRFTAEVIAYPTNRVLGYPELADWVSRQLPTNQPYILLGESFGGPLAILIAARRSAALCGLVLCASFARYPGVAGRVLKPLTSMLPVAGVSPLLLDLALFGGAGRSRGASKTLQQLLRSSDARVLRHRVAAVLSVDVRAQLSALALPVLVLRATADWLVPGRATRELVRLLPHARQIDIPSPHAMLAAAPDRVAETVADFIATLILPPSAAPRGR